MRVLQAIIAVLIFTPVAFGQQQRVAVVMSGGAAKGIAHIGVLKALEENEIPIDYVVGTSMGGIVAGCYAAGMSPSQIEDIVLSDDFLNWVNGRPERGHNYYFHRDDDNASFLKLNLSLDSLFNVQFNSAIAKDLSLNFALAEKLAQPSAVANNNFDSLFVPLRVVAADVFTQTEVVLRSGVLSDALRATQTVPFFYSPIRVDGKYLFDGGVYNNFPVDVAERDFQPDVVIGSNVSSKLYREYPYGEDDALISRSLLYMLLDKSDPGQVPPTGVYIQPPIDGYTAFDFAKARALIDSGYRQTMRQMEEIKSKVQRRVSCDKVALQRNHFNSRMKPLEVGEIQYDGFNPNQQRFINRFFRDGKRPLYYTDVKRGYYTLVTNPYFHNVYPSFGYDTARQQYRFKIARRPQNNFQVDFGGVIASRSISNIFLGLNYYNFNRALTHFQGNFSTGSFYKSASLIARMDLPNFGQFYLQPEAVFNSWDFLEGRDLVVQKFKPTVLDRIDRRLGVRIGIPAGKQFKTEVYGFYVSNTDEFTDAEVLSSTDTLDVLRLRGFRAGVSFGTSQLNRKQYASRGRAFQVSVDWFDMTEFFEPGNTSVQSIPNKAAHQWWRVGLTAEQYFSLGAYSTGYFLQGTFSNQPVFTNYTGTIVNAPGFFPIQDSRTLLLQNFRSFNFVAGGWRNVFSLAKSLDFRLEAYLFKPIESIVRADNQEAALATDVTQIYFAATSGLVMHSTVGPISLSVNYYDDDENPLGVLLHVGFLLFNKAATD